MKYKETSYVVVSKDEKTWMRLNQSRYGSKLSFTRIGESPYTFQPEKFETIDKAREALVSYLSGNKTKTANDFKIVHMQLVYEDIEENTALPSTYKFSTQSFGINLNNYSPETLRIKIRDILEHNYKVGVETFDYKLGKEYNANFHYEYDIITVTNIKWKE